MSDIMQRLASLGTATPEIALQMLGMVIDGVGTATEWSGEQLDQLGEMTPRHQGGTARLTADLSQ